MRLVVWGLGKQYELIKDFIFDEIVGYIDLNKVGERMPDGLVVSGVSALTELRYDKILVTIENHKASVLKIIEQIDSRILEKVIYWKDCLNIKKIVQKKRWETIVIKKDMLQSVNKVYVIAPTKTKSGGPELLHQLVYNLRQNNVKVVIAYATQLEDIRDATDENYRKYVGENAIWAKDIPDETGNIVVIPEIYGEWIFRFSKARIYFWWLSVDNFFLITRLLGKLDDIREKASCHLYQSEYAREFLEMINIPKNIQYELSDYINDKYLEYDYSRCARQNIVAYNPKKGIENTRKLISALSDIEFVPIQNMTTEQVLDLLSHAKVYIDFGNHPGKDRLPREAAMLGCCIVTGKRGSAGNDIDIPIEDTFKFDEETCSIDDVAICIRRCIEDYDNQINHFSEYRRKISKEKERFKQQVKEIFGEV